MIPVLEARPSGPARAPADWRPRAAAEGRRPDAFHRPARPEPATRAATGGRDHHDRSPAVRAISRAAVAGSVFIHRSGDASMFRARHEQKRKRAAAIAIESLEDRVVLTAGAASVEIQYLRAINHLNSLLQRRVNQIQAMLTRRVAHVDAQYEAALTRSAARLGGGPAEVRTARAQLARSTATADAKINSVVGGADRQVGRFTASFDRQLAGVTGRFGRLNGTIRRANPYFAANFHNTLAAIDAGIPAEGQAAQGAVQGGDGPGRVRGRAGRYVRGRGRPQAAAAAGSLAETSESQVASEKAAVAQFWDRYYSSFNPLRAEMAAIASALLPPVHLGRGTVTGPLGHGAQPRERCHQRDRYRDGDLHRDPRRRGYHGHRLRHRDGRRRHRRRRHRARHRHHHHHRQRPERLHHGHGREHRHHRSRHDHHRRQRRQRQRHRLDHRYGGRDYHRTAHDLMRSGRPGRHGRPPPTRVPGPHDTPPDRGAGQTCERGSNPIRCLSPPCPAPRSFAPRRGGPPPGRGRSASDRPGEDRSSKLDNMIRLC